MAAKLRRDVEMLQWVEHTSTKYAVVLGVFVVCLSFTVASVF